MQVIVTTDTTLVLNVERASDEPLVLKFVQDLQRRLARASGLAPVDEGPPGAEPPADGSLGGEGLPAALCPAARGVMDARAANEKRAAEALAEAEDMAADMPGSAREAQQAEIPYELRVR